MTQQPDGIKDFSIQNYLQHSSRREKHATASGDAAITEEVDADDLEKGWQGKIKDYYVPNANYSPEEIFAGNNKLS